MNDEVKKHEARRRRYLEMFPRLLHKGMPWLEFGPGWDHLAIRLLEDIDALLTDEAAAAFEVRQVKEKYGTLRFYYGFDSQGPLHMDLINPGEGRQRLVVLPERQGPEKAGGRSIDEKMDALIRLAEEESERTCDRCGAPGRMRQGSWLRVRCDACTTKAVL